MSTYRIGNAFIAWLGGLVFVITLLPFISVSPLKAQEEILLSTLPHPVTSQIT
jgi:hypothetical protein